jgi:hypothetical protein
MLHLLARDFTEIVGACQSRRRLIVADVAAAIAGSSLHGLFGLSAEAQAQRCIPNANRRRRHACASEPRV